MRWYELIKENDESSSAGPSGNTGKKRPFHKDQNNAIPGVTRYPDTPAHYYNMYRFGVHMARSPSDQDMSPAGPTANEMVTLAYSQADLDIIKNSAKAMGFKGSQMTSHGSREPEDTYTVSPTSNWNKK
jgi:hypothetical protein